MELILKQYEGNKVRTQVDDDGNLWFSAKDVCSVLDISKYRDAVSRLDDDESCPLRVDASTKTEIFVSESGLYSLVLKSIKPEAKKFKKWITSEVIPSIRKTGSYDSKQAWIAARTEGKGVRKILTDTMKTFIEYAKKQGSQSADMYYTNFSKMVNSELIEFDKKPLNLRDHLNTSQLHRISVAEQIIIQSIVECVAKQIHYKEVYKLAKEKIHVFASTVGKSKIGQTEKQTLLLEFSA